MPSSPTALISIFDYRDARIFLRDWYADTKIRHRGFSFRVFSRRAGLASPNFLKLVMDGKRGLSDDGIEKFARGLALNKQEAEFFRHLVHFTQADSYEARFMAEKRLMRTRKLATLIPVERDQYLLYTTWYYPVILELLNHRAFDGSPEWLMHKLSPSITLTDVKRALALLARLGFIIQNESGRWHPSQSVVTTGAETSELVMIEYHRNLLKFAGDMLPEIPQLERDVSSLTIGLPRARLIELKKMIQNFRQDVIRNFSAPGPVDDVVFLNIQMLPATTTERGSP